MTEEEAELIQCNRYFDLVDTVINKISSEIKENKKALITKDDWDIMSEHLRGLGQVCSEYHKLKESLGI